MIYFTCMHGRQKTCEYLKQQTGCATFVLKPTVLNHTKLILGCGTYPKKMPNYTTSNHFVVIEVMHISLGQSPRMPASHLHTA